MLSGAGGRPRSSTAFPTPCSGLPRPSTRPTGQKETRGLSDYYLGNAKIIREKLAGMGFACTGGENSPYIWAKVGTDSWKFFDVLLEKAGVVVTPGSGFGQCGDGYVRISAFNKKDKVEQAMRQMAAVAGELKNLA